MSTEATAVEQATPPVEVVTAIKLVAANFVIGWIAVALSWEYFVSLYPTPMGLMFNQALTAAILVWLYYKVYVGRNWARITLLVFTVLGLWMFSSNIMMGLLAAAPAVAKGSMVLGFLVNLTTMYLLFISKGRHWFRKR
jgi:hypothetical protein